MTDRRTPNMTTHGLTTTFAQSKGADDHALTEPQRSRLIELRAELITPEGVQAVALRQAADAEFIREGGAAYFRDLALEIGVKAFAHPMLSRYFTAAESARRSRESLEKSLSKSDGGINAADVLEGLKRDKQSE